MPSRFIAEISFSGAVAEPEQVAADLGVQIALIDARTTTGADGDPVRVKGVFVRPAGDPEIIARAEDQS